MIRGFIRLGILLLAVWWLSIYWESGAEIYTGAVEWLLETIQLPFTVNLTLALLCISIVWNSTALWFWQYTVRLSKRKGPSRHSLPNQPIRYYFRLRPQASTGAIAVSLLGMLYGIQTLQELDFVSLSAEPFSLVYHLPFLPLIGAKLTPWIVYGISHGVWATMGWLLINSLTLNRPQTHRAGHYAFQEYHATYKPVAKVFVVAVFIAHFPLAAITATTYPHPYHSLVVLCSLSGILVIALAGQFLSIRTMRNHDAWLLSLIQTAQQQGVHSHEYALWEKTLTFLTGEKPSSDDLHTGPEKVDRDVPETSTGADSPPPASTRFRRIFPSPSTTEEPDESETSSDKRALQYGEELLAKATGYLERNKIKKGREILQLLTRHQDQKIHRLAKNLLQSHPEESSRRSTFLRLSRILIVSTLALAVVAGLGLAIQWSMLPGAEETRKLARSAHIHMEKTTTEGKNSLALFGNRYDYSLNTSLDNISTHFQNAVIASEDHRFYDHGPPYILAKFIQAGVVCAAKKINPLANGACQGNSTIPQQLARNLFLSEERSIQRKVSELLWAMKMETGLSKGEILDFYMNRIYLGNGNYGIDMASRDYFKKGAAELTAAEAAYLAAAIKRPSWNWRQDRESALKRARLIFQLMQKQGYVHQSLSFDENFTPHRGMRSLHKPYLGHLWQWVRGEVEPFMKSLPDGNYKVLTSLNAEVEIYAEKALNKEISRLRRMGKPVSQGAVVVMRPHGEILAMVGGVGKKGRFFNRAKRTQGLLPRPPASAFKPFVYLSALELGLTPTTSIDARPVSIPMKGQVEPYRPQNHDKKYYGDVSLRDGLVHSINTAAVRLLYDRVGFDNLFDTVKRLGIPPETLGRQWGLALGQSGVPLVEMTAAYAVFANGGEAVQPYAVSAITNESGKTLWRRPNPKTSRVFQSHHISNLNSMLGDVVRYGTGKRAARGLPAQVNLAGKTGTGDDFVDAWFIGYTADLVIGVWLGNDTPITMDGLYGGTAPARVCNDILTKLISYTDITSGEEQLP